MRLSPIFALLLLTAACRPDQIQHLSNTKEIAKESANWEVKRIMPADLLQATHWAGDTLTQTADRALLRTLTEKLVAGSLVSAAAYCRPETYPATDSMARELYATPRRVAYAPATAPPPDTARLVRRESQEVFFYQRPILASNALCLRCHGEVGPDISAADFATLQKSYPQNLPIGFRLGQTLGAWQVQLERSGVAEFYTMKTRKVHKRRL